MKTQALEDRVETLEREVAELKQRLGKPEDTATWLARISGSMKDISQADWDEFQRLMREAEEEDERQREQRRAG